MALADAEIAPGPGNATLCELERGKIDDLLELSLKRELDRFSVRFEFFDEARAAENLNENDALVSSL